MKLISIDNGYFKLDGGAMFGVVPKSIWNRRNPADDKNLCTWAARSLLIEKDNNLIIIDSGLGNKQSFDFFKHYDRHGEGELISSIQKAGYGADQITDHFITHLHFDHCGGSVTKKGEKLDLTFPNATYWSNSKHWNWALNPNKREEASFLKENIEPIEQSGNLKFTDQSPEISELFDVIYVDGHTEQLMVPVIHFKNRIIAFVSDLIPSIWHLAPHYIMSYDVRPLISMQEKEQFLEWAYENNIILFFQHDPVNECCTLKKTDKGIREDEIFQLQELT